MVSGRQDKSVRNLGTFWFAAFGETQNRASATLTRPRFLQVLLVFQTGNLSQRWDLRMLKRLKEIDCTDSHIIKKGILETTSSSG